MRNVDHRIVRAVQDEGVATARIQSKQHGGPVAQQSEGLVRSALAHDRMARLPVSTRPIQVAAAGQQQRVDTRVRRTGQRRLKRAHGEPENADAGRINVPPAVEVADRLHDIGDHESAHPRGHAGRGLDEPVVLAGAVLVLVVRFAFADGVVRDHDCAGGCVHDAGVVGVPA